MSQQAPTQGASLMRSDSLPPLSEATAVFAGVSNEAPYVGHEERARASSELSDASINTDATLCSKFMDVSISSDETLIGELSDSSIGSGGTVSSELSDSSTGSVATIGNVVVTLLTDEANPVYCTRCLQIARNSTEGPAPHHNLATEQAAFAARRARKRVTVSAQHRTGTGVIADLTNKGPRHRGSQQWTAGSSSEEAGSGDELSTAGPSVEPRAYPNEEDALIRCARTIATARKPAGGPAPRRMLAAE